MLALTVVPGKRDSARIDEVPEPPVSDGPVLVETLSLGVCGTDREIIEGQYGWPPAGIDRLILGHESIGRVLEAPPDSGLTSGDLVVGIVRRPDPVPCPNCAVGEWDMCRNGLYTECGIKGRDGFGAERYRIEPEYVVRIDPTLGSAGVLLEPASIVAKAWEHVERIGARTLWQPHRVLVIGAGPIGLLAALMGVQRGLEVHVLDRVTEGPRAGLLRDLGATYHTSSIREVSHEADVVIECTGVGQLMVDAIQHTSPGGIVCLTGICSGGRSLDIDATMLNRTMVLENDVVFGSVNANRRHYEAAAEALTQANPSWLKQLITRRVPLHRWLEAMKRQPTEVKTLIDLASHTS
jgi:threonine dehydrogenase-like Zn-dependent dehydrogenase